MKVAQWCLTLCNPIDYTVQGILQGTKVEWVAFTIPRGSSQFRDKTQVSHTAGGFFTSLATGKAQEYCREQLFSSQVYLPNPGIKPGTLYSK